MADGLCVQATARGDSNIKVKDTVEILGVSHENCMKPKGLAGVKPSFFIRDDDDELCSNYRVNGVLSLGVHATKMLCGGATTDHVEFPTLCTNEGDNCRKKRCADRYDSSESSDSGVATLSCTDCSASSSSSGTSDITEPCSPYSPASSNSESGDSWPKMAPNVPWPWPAGKDEERGPPPTPPPLSPPAPAPLRRSSSTAPTSRSPSPSHKRLKVDHGHKRCCKAAAGAHQQGKITEYFKAQVKPLNGTKKELVALAAKVGVEFRSPNGPSIPRKGAGADSREGKKCLSDASGPVGAAVPLPAAVEGDRTPKCLDRVTTPPAATPAWKVSKLSEGKKNGLVHSPSAQKLTALLSSSPKSEVGSKPPSLPEPKDLEVTNATISSSVGKDLLPQSPEFGAAGESASPASCLTVSLPGSSCKPSLPSPILSAPRTIRFPAVQYKSGSQLDAQDVIVCQWSECDVQFETSTALLEHLQVSHVNPQTQTQLSCDGENYVCLWTSCKVYGRTSCSRSWLERHVLSHGGNKPFRCIVDGCGQRFSSQTMLERHVNSHFNQSESSSSGSSTRRTLDGSNSKLFRRNGKKLRYRRQPWSGRACAHCLSQPQW